MTIFKNIQYALRNLPRRGQHNVVKILCLAFGLSISAVVIAEIYYEQTFDQCFPDYKRICRVTEGFKMQSQPFMEGDNTPGGVAPKMRQIIPQVELATRVNPLFGGEVETDDRVRVWANIYLADSCFLRMFPAKVLEGDARKALTAPFCCMVNRSTAERLGGNVIGKRITPTEMTNFRLTIVAVYEDYPHNTSFHDHDVIGSMNTQKSFGFDGQNNLVGNDRYQSFVKLKAGTRADALQPLIRKMVLTHFPAKQLREAGVELTFKVTPISKYFTQADNVKQMFWILSVLAFVLLTASVLNYILIVVGNLTTRSREMAVRKCYGAGPKALFGITFGEAFLHLLIAVVLGMALIFVCHGTIEQLLSAPLSVLLFNRGVWILGVILLLVLVVGGIVPGMLYNRMPVAIAFRGLKGSRHSWKVLLLGVEFAMVSMLLSLLLVVSLQYNHIVGFDMGYDCKDKAVINITALSPSERQTAVGELRKLGGVKALSACSSLIFEGGSGNNVQVPGESSQLFNVADLYTVADDYFPMMGIPIVEGKAFAHNTDSLRQVMVSRTFARKMKELRGWDNVVGRKVLITEHSGSENKGFITIVGVYRDLHIGSAEQNDRELPSVIFYGNTANPSNKYLLLQLSDFSAENISQIQERLQRFFPGKTILVENLENLKNRHYTATKNFRDGVLVAGLVVLFISLIGLVGYVNDEVNHRHKEIAIRKVNGATTADVVRLFLGSILKTAVPAVIAGCIVAWLVAAQWLTLYDNRIGLSVGMFVGIAVFVLFLVPVIVFINCYKVAISNPAEFLKQE